MNLLKRKPKYTVEQIHAEFDAAESKIIDMCNNVLSELKIPTETQVEKKAKLLKEIGFDKSETVKLADSIKARGKEIEATLTTTRTQLEYIQSLKVKYPTSKFITVDVLEAICEKYNLIHAPVNNYIKDVPEKNLLEIKNAKLLDYEDKVLPLLKIIPSYPKENVLLNIFNKTEYIFSPEDLKRINYSYATLLRWFNEGDTTWAYCAVSHGIDGKSSAYPRFDAGRYTYKKAEVIDKTGYFIAAPPSHFDLQDLKKKSKFGFFEVQNIEVKDPVVFEYCRNEMVRIVTKWGTEDDQSYLDPALINEIEN